MGGWIFVGARRAAFASLSWAPLAERCALTAELSYHRERQGIADHSASLSQKLSATNQAFLISLNHEAMLVSIGY
jgi:hypothetical protein